MSKLDKKYNGRGYEDRWFSYNQKVKITALPELPGTQNLNSFHILDSAEEKAI
jgi:hypothetical protein